jgi:hypothetical protein
MPLQPDNIGTPTYFKKYDSPILRCSKNLGRNFAITPFGGSGGIAASDRGKVCSNLVLRVSNSEYLFRTLNDAPCNMISASVRPGGKHTYIQSFHGNVPYDKRSNASPAIHHDVVVNMDCFRPAELLPVVSSILVVEESDAAYGRCRLDGNVRYRASMSLRPVWRGCYRRYGCRRRKDANGG